MARPPFEVLDAMSTAVARNRLDARLGKAMAPAGNWHQTLSERYADAPSLREKMLRAGARVSAQACTLTLNRIRDHASDAPIHWAFKAKGKPKDFVALLFAVDLVLFEQGLGNGARHMPHVTISYGAPDRVGPTSMLPIHWTIDEIQIVIGGGRPYRYDVLGQWPLRPAAPDPSERQGDLFAPGPN